MTKSEGLNNFGKVQALPDDTEDYRQKFECDSGQIRRIIQLLEDIWNS